MQLIYIYVMKRKRLLPYWSLTYSFEIDIRSKSIDLHMPNCERIYFSKAPRLFYFLLVHSLRAVEDFKRGIAKYPGFTRHDDFDRLENLFADQRIHITDGYFREIGGRLKRHFEQIELRMPLKKIHGGYLLDVDPRKISIDAEYVDRWVTKWENTH